MTTGIEVKFDAAFLLSDSASIGVAHEGTHVEDAFAFGQAWDQLVSSGTMLTDPRNMQQWDTENHAFHVQSYLFEAMSKSDKRWGTWQTSWAKLDAQQQEGKRQAGSTKIIRDAYKWTPEDKGWDFNSRSCRPCQ